MKFHFISDTHNDHRHLSLPSCDVLVHCGDVGTKGNLTEAKEFLWWFVKQKAKYKIIVFGNHDERAKKHPEAIMLAHELGIIVLSDDLIDIEGVKIYGNNNTFKGHEDPRFLGKEWGSDEDRTKAWENIPKDLDLLITHMPPYGILDLTKNNQNIGCKMLLDKVKEVKPRFHFYGHVHELAGKSENKGQTIFFNAACKNRDYLLISNGYSFEIKEKI